VIMDFVLILFIDVKNPIKVARQLLNDQLDYKVTDLLIPPMYSISDPESRVN